uniref:uncharacterized protein isoform X5 n=1 Tax=Pristiophorus japonicus TaxID=55135 RepID=UPI00398E4DAD
MSVCGRLWRSVAAARAASKAEFCSKLPLSRPALRCSAALAVSAKSFATGGEQEAAGKNYVIIEKNGSIMTIGLNRPEVRNAVNRNTALQLLEAFTTFERDKALTAAVLYGTGGHFCAGYDLKELAQAAVSVKFDQDVTKDPGPMDPDGRRFIERNYQGNGGSRRLMMRRRPYPQRIFREKRSYLDLTDPQCVRRLHFQKEVINEICQLIKADLQPSTINITALSAEMKVTAALSFYACSSF